MEKVIYFCSFIKANSLLQPKCSPLGNKLRDFPHSIRQNDAAGGSGQVALRDLSRKTTRSWLWGKSLMETVWREVRVRLCTCLCGVLAGDTASATETHPWAFLIYTGAGRARGHRAHPPCAKLLPRCDTGVP